MRTTLLAAFKNRLHTDAKAGAGIGNRLRFLKVRRARKNDDARCPVIAKIVVALRKPEYPLRVDSRSWPRPLSGSGLKFLVDND